MNNIDNIFNKIENYGKKIINFIFLLISIIILFSCKNIVEILIMMTIILLFLSNLLKETKKFKDFGELLSNILVLVVSLEIFCMLTITELNNNRIYLIIIYLLVLILIFYIFIKKMRRK